MVLARTVAPASAIFKRLGKGASYGASTTHRDKLLPRIEGGGGGGCPVLTFAIRPDLYVDDGDPTPDQVAAVAAATGED